MEIFSYSVTTSLVTFTSELQFKFLHTHTKIWNWTGIQILKYSPQNIIFRIYIKYDVLKIMKIMWRCLSVCYQCILWLPITMIFNKKTRNKKKKFFYCLCVQQGNFCFVLLEHTAESLLAPVLYDQSYNLSVTISVTYQKDGDSIWTKLRKPKVAPLGSRIWFKIHSCRFSPDINIVSDSLVFSGVATADVETTALVCHQLKVGLYHNCVEVFNAPIRLHQKSK